ncbi:exodeoxyribonuclease III [Candidatus Dojkabacteria bacterium]|nr:exodeoxyribonuclease III [Candidatus Dojkabacteria bacterium]
MEILSWNVNGLRAVYKKGFLEWLHKAKPDILCLQETKAQEDQLPFDLTSLSSYITYFNSAKKKGYSGVAIYTKEKPSIVKSTLGQYQFDKEGRILNLKFKNFRLINLYIPHGGRKKEKLSYKLEVYEELFKYIKRFKKEKLILTGDFNIAHEEIDLKRPKQNLDNIMFTEEERQKLDKLIGLNFIDTFRYLNPRKKTYSWWPYFNDARERNLGWRIDYIFTSKSLKRKIKKAFILTDVKGSDHCPVGVELDD